MPLAEVLLLPMRWFLTTEAMGALKTPSLPPCTPGGASVWLREGRGGGERMKEEMETMGDEGCIGGRSGRKKRG